MSLHFPVHWLILNITQAHIPNTRTRTHTHTQIHTQTYTQTHTHTHTHTHGCSPLQTDEKGQPVAVKAKPKIPMMDVVAEMMIAANAAVAQRTATAFPGAALLRNHPPPREEAFEQVNE